MVSYGLEATYIDLDLQHAPDRASRTHALAHDLRHRFPNADIVVGGGVIVIVGDVDEARIPSMVTQSAPGAAIGLSPKNHTLPIVFDGPDLDDVATALKLSPDEIVQSLVNTDFLVELVGFLPGFGYLGPLDLRLVSPRRKNPRPRVPAGSLGIAGEFAGIYPFASPGGWNLVGRSVGPSVFDVNREAPFLFAAGDRVRFDNVAPADVAAANEERSAEKNARVEPPAFVVEAAPACATIQDAGRIGRLHSGMPPSGPLDPETFAKANLAVGNAPTEAALEIPLGRFVLRAMGNLIVSLDGDKPISLADGERFEVPEHSMAVRYLAFRGGIDVPPVLGSYATLLVARLGGYHGRPLRKRDIVPIADRIVAECQTNAHKDHEAVDITEIMIDPGPHQQRFSLDALDVLLSSTYFVSPLADRVGVRLDGPKIPRTGGDSALPVPMIRGAMQIATDGTPIVFGPDHPTTGGYPVLAVVRRSSWGRFARRRAGSAIRFVLGR